MYMYCGLLFAGYVDKNTYIISILRVLLMDVREFYVMR